MTATAAPIVPSTLLPISLSELNHYFVGTTHHSLTRRRRLEVAVRGTTLCKRVPCRQTRHLLKEGQPIFPTIWFLELIFN